MSKVRVIKYDTNELGNKVVLDVWETDVEIFFTPGGNLTSLIQDMVKKSLEEGKDLSFLHLEEAS